eukprot:Plantae.Rhodophyta-Hildenbrandia_rubra.ctg24307.p2 GENE.Plantae.Rhodophyta-Hildenbrandia_rubra.ctg24307~~Plantae.Rhodophyta-Hildenbrandia_rubra.ctg24307.p2  ORF type:complete len:113 (+),score=1.18 Plantae.Rhodophyta-Hildenbrandia_rubra.ctg24307:272-610(+)
MALCDSDKIISLIGPSGAQILSSLHNISSFTAQRPEGLQHNSEKSQSKLREGRRRRLGRRAVKPWSLRSGLDVSVGMACSGRAPRLTAPSRHQVGSLLACAIGRQLPYCSAP